MSLTAVDIKKIAHLARLKMPEADIEQYLPQLQNILEIVEKMNQIDTSHIEPVANALDLSQRLREDKVTETNQRDEFQKIAPSVESGLYLVPKVIDGE